MDFSFDRFYQLNRKVIIWIILFGLIYILRQFFTLIFLTFIISFFALPLSKNLTRWLNIRHTMAVMLVYLLILIGYVGLFFLVVPSITKQVYSIREELPRMQETLEESGSDLSEKFPSLASFDIFKVESSELNTVEILNLDQFWSTLGGSNNAQAAYIASFLPSDLRERIGDLIELKYPKTETSSESSLKRVPSQDEKLMLDSDQGILEAFDQLTKDISAKSTTVSDSGNEEPERSEKTQEEIQETESLLKDAVVEALNTRVISRANVYNTKIFQVDNKISDIQQKISDLNTSQERSHPSSIEMQGLEDQLAELRDKRISDIRQEISDLITSQKQINSSSTEKQILEDQLAGLRIQEDLQLLLKLKDKQKTNFSARSTEKLNRLLLETIFPPKTILHQVYPAREWINTEIKTWTGKFIKQSPQIILSIWQFIVTTFLGILFSFLIIYDYSRLSKEVKSLAQSRLSDFFSEAARPVVRFAISVGQGFQAIVVIAFITTIMVVITLLAFNVPSIAFLAVVTFVTSLVPVVGVIFEVIPIALVIFLNEQLGINTAIWVGVALLVIHLIIGYVITPIIFGRRFNMNLVAVLFILFIGNQVAGVWGMILGIPVANYLLRDVFLVSAQREGSQDSDLSDSAPPDLDDSLSESKEPVESSVVDVS